LVSQTGFSRIPDEWSPFSREVDDRQIDGVVELLREFSLSGPVVDLGCGDGRILVPLAERGVPMIGVDDDPAALAAARHRLSERGLEATLIRADFLAGIPDIPHGVAAVLCLGNTFMMIHDVRVAVALLREIMHRVAPGGVFLIDDFPFDCWREIAEGNWQEGISEDGTQQIVYRPGDPVFALRRGNRVNPDNWTIKPGESLLRLWSMGDLELLAMTAGAGSPRWLDRGRLIAFRKPAEGGQ